MEHVRHFPINFICSATLTLIVSNTLIPWLFNFLLWLYYNFKRKALLRARRGEAVTRDNNPGPSSAEAAMSK